MKYISETDIIKFLNSKRELSKEFGYVFTYNTMVGWEDELMSASNPISMPCQVGDSVWTYSPLYGVVEAKVSMLTQKADKSWKIRISHHSNVYEYTEEDIGKKFFLDAASCNANSPKLNLDNTINILEVLNNE